MLVLLFVLLFTGQLLVNSANGISYRLPQEVRPLKYDLEIRPDFQNDIFTGDVSILVIANKNASTITLNQLGLKMPPKETVLVLGITMNETVTVASVGPGESEDQHFFIITLAAPLVTGHNYLVKIPNFQGAFTSDNQHGFYYARYVDDLGNHKTFATTQFEPVFARKAFPCFDEPDLKAKFNLVVKRPSSNYISVSNTPRDENLSNGLTDVFEETELMSTYLVTFIISEMEFSKLFERHRVLAPKYELEKGRHSYSLNASYHVLNEMERYTEIPYTFKKLDHASIPNKYYSAGAMENWGLITYRDDILLLSPSSSVPYRRQAVTVISHEIGHQWFGNLVSPKWWDYIWLNEGFANYFENYLADKVEPDMDLWKRFIIFTGKNAMVYDGNPEYSRPMTFSVEEPYNIMPLFDIIAYMKSGAVIRMLENMVSRKIFRQGLVYYLKEMQYNGATPHDLYKNIQRALNESTHSALPSSMTVESIMTTWDSVSSFPLVTATRSYGNITDNVYLKQRVYNNYHNQGALGNWAIPINYATKRNHSFENTSPTAWLTRPSGTITVSQLGDDDWFILNVQQSGYYRVNYDSRNWELISDALKKDHRVIHPLNRAKLLEDSLYLGLTGDLSPEIFSKVSEYVVNEEDPLVLAVVQTTFAEMDNKFYYAKGQSDFKDRVIYLLRGAVSRLTFDEKLNDSPSEKEARASVIFWLCKMGHMECRTKSLAKFSAWKDNRASISPELESAIFCGALRNSSQIEFDYLFEVFTNTTDYHFKTRVASGLSCMEDEKSLKRFFEYCLHDCSPSLLEHVLRNMHASSKVGFETALDLFFAHIERLSTKLGDQTQFIVEELASRSYSAEHVWKLRRAKFLSKSGTLFDRALATMARNAAWLSQNESNVLRMIKWYKH
ncbi:aminopeptidase N-like [Photinus pyralis]|nr:aminopeptidase N-like [Photinus pyralis]